MESAEKIIIHKPHRKLLRTQNSLQKMMDRNPDSHVKKMKILMHRQMKDSFRNSNHLNTLEVTKIETRDLENIKSRVKSNNKSHSNIFRNAHLITASESFIRPKKNRKTIEKEYLEQRVMYQSYSEKRLYGEQTPLNKKSLSSKAIKIVDQKQCQSTIEKEQVVQFRKMSKGNQAGCSEPVDKQSKSKKKSYTRHLRVYSQSSSMRFQTELSVPTIRIGTEKDEENNSNNVIINPAPKLGEVHREADDQREEISNLNRELSLELDECKTIEKQAVITSELNLHDVGVQSKPPETTESKHEKLNKIQRATSNNKYYLETDCINHTAIQEVEFQTIETVDNKKKNSGRFVTLETQIINNPYLPWESSVKQNNESKEPHIQDKPVYPKEPKKKSSKKKQIKVKSTPKIIDSTNQLQQTNNLSDKKNTNQILSEKSSLKTEHLETQQTKQGKNIKNTKNVSSQLPNLPQKSSLSPFNPNISQIKQKMQKINESKEQLQMFSEMATFFSKKSKCFKQGTQSGQFLREKGGLKWHKLIFLYFKFGYFNLLLFEAYFKWGSTFVKVKQDDMLQLSEQNQGWAQTLVKIQKSVRKNMQISSQDEWVELRFPEIKDQSIDQVMDQILTLKKGTSACYNYMANMANMLFDETATLVKSVFISKFLKENTQASTAFREGILRVVNSCIILELFFRNRPHIKLQPITKVQELENISLEIFKQFYNKLIHQIFCQ